MASFRSFTLFTLLVLLGAGAVFAQGGPVYAVNRIPVSGRAQLSELVMDSSVPLEARLAAIKRLRFFATSPAGASINASEFSGPIIQALSLPGKINEPVRETACEQLTFFGHEKNARVTGALTRVMNDTGETFVIRKAAARSLGRMSGNATGATSALNALLSAELRRGPDANNIPLVRTVVKSLGDLGQENARANLLAVLSSNYPGDIKQAARKALTMLPPRR